MSPVWWLIIISPLCALGPLLLLRARAVLPLPCGSATVGRKSPYAVTASVLIVAGPSLTPCAGPRIAWEMYKRGSGMSTCARSKHLAYNIDRAGAPPCPESSQPNPRISPVITDVDHVRSGRATSAPNLPLARNDFARVSSLRAFINSAVAVPAAQAVDGAGRYT